VDPDPWVVCLDVVTLDSVEVVEAAVVVVEVAVEDSTTEELLCLFPPLLPPLLCPLLVHPV
jgi:hypothetical protein